MQSQGDHAKKAFIFGGFNVYPKEIEDFIDDIPGVKESAVVAKPGATLDASQIQAYLKTKIANFKVPKKVVIAKELLRNTMGKVQKNLLREECRIACL